jgi:hypothetical protein
VPALPIHARLQGDQEEERQASMRLIPRAVALVAFATLVTVLSFAAPAYAGAPKFHSVDSSVDNAGALVVSFDERGLGNDNVDYSLTADGTAVYACINKGGNHPQASNKETVNAEVSGAASFEPKNGRIVAEISAGPPSAGDFSCPNGQRLVLASVSYTNIAFADTTNGVSADVPDTSRVFFAV